MKNCCRCDVIKPFKDFHKNKASKDGYKAACKECRKIESKESYDPVLAKEYRELNKEKRKDSYNKWYSINREERLKKRKKWRENNKDKIKKYKTENKDKIQAWDREDRKKPLRKLKDAFRSRIRQAIKNKGFKKKGSTEKMLGCTWLELKTHLEKQFTDGMNWTNYVEWHVDHIKPLALAETEQELIEFNHYTNLQPLWAGDNLSKGAKYDVSI